MIDEMLGDILGHLTGDHRAKDFQAHVHDRGSDNLVRLVGL